MVALAIGLGVFGACHAALWGWKWYLAFRREALVHQPIAELERKLVDIERKVTALSLAPLTRR